MRLQDKVAIVTGAASGMGAATAKLFVAEGAKVVLTDILKEEGSALADEIGGAARFHRLDVTSETDWDALVAETLSAFGRVDILINNAGVSGSHPDVLNTETWDEQMNMNARGVFLGMRAVISKMQEAGGGARAQGGGVGVDDGVGEPPGPRRHRRGPVAQADQLGQPAGLEAGQ